MKYEYVCVVDRVLCVCRDPMLRLAGSWLWIEGLVGRLWCACRDRLLR